MDTNIKVDTIVNPPTTLGIPKASLEAIIQPADGLDHRYAVLNENAAEMLKEHIRGVKRRTFARIDDASRLPFVNAEEKSIWLPEALFPHIDDIGIVIAYLATELGYRVQYYCNDNHVLNHSEETEKVAIGLKLGATDTSNISLSKNKSSYELGRAMAFAIRVRGYFRRNKSLTEAALQPNNFFFGNNPTEQAGKYAVHFRLRTLLYSLTGIKPYADALYKVLAHLLEEWGLRSLDEDTLSSVIKHNLISIQCLEGRFFRKTEVTTGKGRKLRTVTELRGPKKPSSSPLFLKEESKLISDLLTPLFESTNGYHNIDNYHSAVMKHTFRKISNYVRDVIEARWHVLQEYASVTTKRLAAVRMIAPDNSRKKKSACSVTDLVEFLQQRNFPGEKLYSECALIIPSKVQHYWTEMGLEIPQAWIDSMALKDILTAFFRSGITSTKVVWKEPIFPEGWLVPKKENLVPDRPKAIEDRDFKSSTPHTYMTYADTAAWIEVKPKHLRR